MKKYYFPVPRQEKNFFSTPTTWKRVSTPSRLFLMLQLMDFRSHFHPRQPLQRRKINFYIHFSLGKLFFTFSTRWFLYDVDFFCVFFCFRYFVFVGALEGKSNCYFIFSTFTKMFLILWVKSERRNCNFIVKHFHNFFVFLMERSFVEGLRYLKVMTKFVTKNSHWNWKISFDITLNGSPRKLFSVDFRWNSLQVCS